jgi:hypothetical protein
MKRIFPLLALAVGTLSLFAQTKSDKHSITVKFDYDFRITPACTVSSPKNCVQEFVVYDISAGSTSRTKLASASPPAGAKGLVKSISITTPSLLFESGKHRIAVVARTSGKVESDVNKCTTWVDIP